MSEEYKRDYVPLISGALTIIYCIWIFLVNRGVEYFGVAEVWVTILGAAPMVIFGVAVIIYAYRVIFYD